MTLAARASVSLGEPDFAHPSERAFAQILDFYGIEWDYEPTTFVLERDARGGPRSAFTPDFYLPAHELYVELTTMRQALVTKKNRKVRLLRQRYPHVRLKILYARHVEALLAKHDLGDTLIDPVACGERERMIHGVAGDG